MNWRRNYWVYSAGLLVVWLVVLGLIAMLRPVREPVMLLVFGGYAIGWVSTTIARYVYPPPTRWTSSRS